MILYLGLTGKKTWVEALRQRGIGRVLVRGKMKLNMLYEGERWFFDNGAFADWQHKRRFDDKAFTRDLYTLMQSGLCPQFIVTPDKPADESSLQFSNTRFWRWLAHGHGTQHVLTDQLKEAA